MGGRWIALRLGLVLSLSAGCPPEDDPVDDGESSPNPAEDRDSGAENGGSDEPRNPGRDDGSDGGGDDGSPGGNVNGGANGNVNGGANGNMNGGANGNVNGGTNLDIRRSLVVTEHPMLTGFSLERVMNQLVSQSGVAGLTATKLFQQLWDTQNAGPGLGLGPHCDDTVDPTYGSVINGYPYTCRGTLAEGGEAACDPFAVNSTCGYIPIALFNRFDLAPRNGAHCGEHRIVYARASGRTDARARNLIIFEAVLPNPHPVQGLKGCKKIADFWGDLSKDASLTRRAASLENFYFKGLANVEPVVHVDHYGNMSGGYGQIRTNQFIQPDSITPRVWSLREFKLIKGCATSPCTLKMVPVTNKTNPFGPLFNVASEDPNALAFQAYLPSQIVDLNATSLAGLRMDVPDVYNSAQSQASGSTETNYLLNFGTAPSSFRSGIDAALVAAGSTLRADDIVARAQTQSCAGCHRLSNNAALGGGLIWPASLGFTHVSERDVDVEVVGGVSRFKISAALEIALLPHRKFVLEDYIDNPPPNAQSQKSIGGSTTH